MICYFFSDMLRITCFYCNLQSYYYYYSTFTPYLTRLGRVALFAPSHTTYFSHRLGLLSLNNSNSSGVLVLFPLPNIPIKNVIPSTGLILFRKFISTTLVLLLFATTKYYSRSLELCVLSFVFDNNSLNTTISNN